MQEGDIDRPDFIYYEDFMKDYTSLLYRIIPNEVAIDWLQQIEAWLKICCDNEKKCKIPVFFLKNENA